MSIPNPDWHKYLPLGLYELTWADDGGTSLAAVGTNALGERWYAPANWLTVPSYDWTRVQSAKLIRPAIKTVYP